MNKRWTFFALAALPMLGGCWLVIGESFTGYTTAPSDASTESAIDAGSDGAGDSASNVGDPCAVADPTCGKLPNTACLDEGNYGFPGGYCTITKCSTTSLCPIGATCADLTGEFEPACYKSCDSGTDCRTNYGCYELGSLFRSGARTRICHPDLFQCNMQSDCPPAKPTCGDGGGPGFCN
jgi:hypothetical protein